MAKLPKKCGTCNTVGTIKLISHKELLSSFVCSNCHLVYYRPVGCLEMAKGGVVERWDCTPAGETLDFNQLLLDELRRTGWRALFTDYAACEHIPQIRKHLFNEDN